MPTDSRPRGSQEVEPIDLTREWLGDPDHGVEMAEAHESAAQGTGVTLAVLRAELDAHR